MPKKAAILAEYAIEYVVEQLAYKDLRDAFRDMCEEIDPKKENPEPNQQKGKKIGKIEKEEPNNETPNSDNDVPAADDTPDTDSKPSAEPSAEDRFLFYNSLQLKLNVELKCAPTTNDAEEDRSQIHLGDQVEATLILERESKQKDNNPQFKNKMQKKEIL